MEILRVVITGLQSSEMRKNQQQTLPLSRIIDKSKNVYDRKLLLAWRCYRDAPLTRLRHMAALHKCL